MFVLQKHFSHGTLCSREQLSIYWKKKNKRVGWQGGWGRGGREKRKKRRRRRKEVVRNKISSFFFFFFFFFLLLAVLTACISSAQKSSLLRGHACLACSVPRRVTVILFSLLMVFLSVCISFQHISLLACQCAKMFTARSFKDSVLVSMVIVDVWHQTAKCMNWSLIGQGWLLRQLCRSNLLSGWCHKSSRLVEVFCQAPQLGRQITLQPC